MGWIPVQWRPRKDELTSKPDIAQKLLSNQNAQQLGQLASVASDMCKLIATAHKDGCEGKLVEQAKLEACTDAVNAGFEAVVVWSCVYKLTVPNQILAIANVHMHKTDIDDLKATLTAKGVTLGKDLDSRMTELLQPGYQAPKPASNDAKSSGAGDGVQKQDGSKAVQPSA